jgi:osmotically-inducible protein OsmY
MGSGKELQRRVLDELDWEPSIDAAHIGVAVNDGVVTLTGSVRTYAEKISAEQATKRLVGVAAVANDLEVRPMHPAQPNDTEIAQAVLRALEWDVAVPHELIKVRVAAGIVTLEGQVGIVVSAAGYRESGPEFTRGNRNGESHLHSSGREGC